MAQNQCDLPDLRLTFTDSFVDSMVLDANAEVITGLLNFTLVILSGGVCPLSQWLLTVPVLPLQPDSSLTPLWVPVLSILPTFLDNTNHWLECECWRSLTLQNLSSTPGLGCFHSNNHLKHQLQAVSGFGSFDSSQYFYLNGKTSNFGLWAPELPIAPISPRWNRWNWCV